MRLSTFVAALLAVPKLFAQDNRVMEDAITKFKGLSKEVMDVLPASDKAKELLKKRNGGSLPSAPLRGLPQQSRGESGNAQNGGSQEKKQPKTALGAAHGQAAAGSGGAQVTAANGSATIRPGSPVTTLAGAAEQKQIGMPAQPGTSGNGAAGSSSSTGDKALLAWVNDPTRLSLVLVITDFTPS